ncbi:CTTNBP2 N-terminal-like protein [Hypomesus transpacificus]|uniref:CTTNBP2 N-terminal-like protein n=1 Tax=Hypomesus transpacificus TaxID=137520 RepID=UPI001F07C5B8|nr:CTTNBP2 N-terminal-like protein [Hypomesus transpacificus]
MLDFLKASNGHMKECKLSMETLSRAELLSLLCVLEGELQARDQALQALRVSPQPTFPSLRAQRRDLYLQERYGMYSLSDPFLALQRDGEAVGGPGGPGATTSPLVVLRLVVGQCRTMQEKMLVQLAAAETRHRRVIADLEEERRRHAEDTAEGDDVTYILEKERERLLQQLEFERGQVRRQEKQQRRQQEEERSRQQLSRALASRLEQEQQEAQGLRARLEEERTRALRMEAKLEEQLAEFDTEREQLRARLRKEEAQGGRLQEQLEEMRRELILEAERLAQDQNNDQNTQLPPGPAPASPTVSNPASTPVLASRSISTPSATSSPATASTTASIPTAPNPSLSPNPSISPNPSLSPNPSPSYQSSYQAGIHQRFHAARHKFEGQADPESPVPQCALPPGDAPSSPGSPPEASPIRQLARSTVTQVLSRFTTQQGASKPAPSNSSPFGTDYRQLAPSSPVTARASGASPLGLRSPSIPRADRGIPPPIPPKKPGLAQSPASPGPSPRAGHMAELSSTCALTSSQDGVKELDRVVSSTS